MREEVLLSAAGNVASKATQISQTSGVVYRGYNTASSAWGLWENALEKLRKKKDKKS